MCDQETLDCSPESLLVGDVGIRQGCHALRWAAVVADSASEKFDGFVHLREWPGETRK